MRNAADDLDRMSLPAPQGYKSLGDFLRQQAMDNPTDPVWGSLGARMARTSAEFEAKRLEVSALLTKINS